MPRLLRLLVPASPARLAEPAAAAIAALVIDDDDCCQADRQTDV